MKTCKGLSQRPNDRTPPGCPCSPRPRPTASGAAVPGLAAQGSSAPWLILEGLRVTKERSKGSFGGREPSPATGDISRGEPGGAAGRLGRPRTARSGPGDGPQRASDIASAVPGRFDGTDFTGTDVTTQRNRAFLYAGMRLIKSLKDCHKTVAGSTGGRFCPWQHAKP